MERYVFRPYGELALFGSAMFLVLFTGISVRAPEALPSREVALRTPTLNLSASGDFQQAVHVNVDDDSHELYRRSSLVAPLHALQVSPQEWVTIYTNSPVGLPRSARARIHLSAHPEPCFGNVMIGCVKIDIEKQGYSIPLHPEGEASFGFTAPAAPGSYWIALDAEWGFSAGTQVFVIDVRA
jgi:hypothetical protein